MRSSSQRSSDSSRSLLASDGRHNTGHQRLPIIPSSSTNSRSASVRCVAFASEGSATGTFGILDQYTGSLIESVPERPFITHGIVQLSETEFLVSGEMMMLEDYETSSTLSHRRTRNLSARFGARLSPHLAISLNSWNLSTSPSGGDRSISIVRGRSFVHDSSKVLSVCQKRGIVHCSPTRSGKPYVSFAHRLAFAPNTNSTITVWNLEADDGEQDDLVGPVGVLWTEKNLRRRFSLNEVVGFNRHSSLENFVFSAAPRSLVDMWDVSRLQHIKMEGSQSYRGGSCLVCSEESGLVYTSTSRLLSEGDIVVGIDPRESGSEFVSQKFVIPSLCSAMACREGKNRNQLILCGGDFIRVVDVRKLRSDVLLELQVGESYCCDCADLPGTDTFCVVSGTDEFAVICWNNAGELMWISEEICVNGVTPVRQNFDLELGSSQYELELLGERIRFLYEKEDLHIVFSRIVGVGWEALCPSMFVSEYNRI